MAALSCPGKMAAIGAVSAAEPLPEYVQVVVGEDEDPGQVAGLEDGEGGSQIQAGEMTPDFLQSIAQSDTVFYVQPDGSLVAGGSLAEETVRAQVSLAEEEAAAAQPEEEEAATTEDARALPTPDPEPREASQQLRTVAHHVALMQGDSGTVTRILNQKQLKSICVQVATLPPKNSTDQVKVQDVTGQNVSDHSTMSSTNPIQLGGEIVQIKPAPEPAQRFLVNPSSSESPFHILIKQAQLASAAKGKTQDPNGNSGLYDPLDEQGACAAHPQNGSHACSSEKPQKRGQKRKRSVKIKTRSGRISRPPKHKAKDYKFLKVGDLIQNSSSDSEDYSELSTEDEDGCKKESAPSHPQPYTVKNSLFQCETCEKSYMGKGGLSRHYRLYPSHGQIDTQLTSDTRKNGDTGVAGQSLPTEPRKPVPRPRKRLLEDPLNPTVTTNPTLTRDGFEFVPLPSSRRGRRQVPGRRFGRPRKILAPDPNEQTAPKVVEMIERCDDTDIKGQVAPSFAKLLSVYDFLLIKVKQDQPDKPLFPHVYKEFERLHSMVKVLAQEYISTIVLGTEKPIEVTDLKVAESLGISEEMMVSVSPAVPSTVTEEQKSESQEKECPAEDPEPPAKRLKVDEAESDHSEEPASSKIATADHETEGQASSVDMDVPDSSAANDLCTNAPSTSSEQVVQMAQSQSEMAQSQSEMAQSQSEMVSCETQQGPLETTHSLLNMSTVRSCDNAYNLLCELPEDLSGFQTQATHEDTGEITPAPELSPEPVGSASTEPGLLLCASSVAGDSPLIAEAMESPPAAEPEAQETYTVATHVPPAVTEGHLLPPLVTYSTDTIAADQCANAFGLSHEHELVFIDSAEETITEEAVVIFANTEAASSHLDTVVALVEM